MIKNVQKIVVPPFLDKYILFLAVYLLSLVWSWDRDVSVSYFVLFFSGGVVWLLSYNFQNFFRKYISDVILIIGLVLGFLFFWDKIHDLGQGNPYSLFLPSNVLNSHNHIGDYWSVVVLGLLINRVKYKKFFYPLFIIGVYLMLASQSRSAYFALAAGLVYYQAKSGHFSVKVLKVVLAGLVVFAVVVGSQKLTLLSRPYFIQSIAGVVNDPLGVGVGNFELVSRNPANHWFGMSGFSSVAHNIVLEMFTGNLLVGSVFLVWLVKIFKSVGNNAYSAVFVALTVNFMFDYTYFIPTMLLVWFLTLGLAQKSTLKKNL